MDSTLFSADTLPPELAERLLAVAIHTLARRPGRRGPDAWSNGGATDRPSSNPLHTLLCVLGPRRTCPDVTCAALARCWWVDLDFASGIGDVELLRIMDRLAQTRGGRGSLPRRPLQWTHVAVDLASKQGFVHVLDWWIERFGAACWYTEEALTGAAEAGHLDTLKWWTDRRQALSCDLNNKILLHATLGGHTYICDWWLTHHHDSSTDAHRVPVMDGLACTLIHAICTNDTEFRMFHWWVAQPFCRAPKVRHLKRVHQKQIQKLQEEIWEHRESSMEVIARIPDLIDSVDLTLPVQAVAGTCAGVLPGDGLTKWLDANAPRVWELLVDVGAMASMAGHVHVLEWAARHPMLDKLNQNQLEAFAFISIGRASGAGHVHVLKWWVTACPWFDKVRDGIAADNRAAVLEAGLAGHVHVLEWWEKEANLPCKCDTFTLQAAAQTGQVTALEWWVQSGKIDASELGMWMNDVIRVASLYNHVNVLDWWAHHQQFAKTNGSASAAITAASFAGSIDALQWWATTPWFSDWHKRGNVLFTFESVQPWTFDWWIEYVWAVENQSHDPERHVQFHDRLFVALARSSCTILLTKYVLRLGFPEIATKAAVLGEPHFADQVGMNAMQTGHVCTYKWWVDCGLQMADPAIIRTHVSQAARHVKVWWMEKWYEHKI